MHKRIKYISHKTINILLIIALSLFLSGIFVLFPTSKTSQKAFAYSTAKTYTWYASIVAQISTSGSIQVNEHRIIDITNFVNKAKRGANSNSSNNNSEEKNNYLNPLVWDFSAFPKQSDVSVEDVRLALTNNNDNIIGTWQSVPEIEYSKKWRGNDGPQKQSWAYDGQSMEDASKNSTKNSSEDSSEDSQQRQVLLYTYLVNADKVSEKQAAEIMTSMSGSSDPNTWDTIKCSIVINYTIQKAATIYKDVADFQWRYISNTWMEETYNVNTVVYVPIGQGSIASPLGKISSIDPNNSNMLSEKGISPATTERNIYAWGHGSSSGVVNLTDSGTVTLKNDIVPAGSDAEIRIVFPTAWLTNLDRNSDISHEDQTKLASILKEESVWRDWRTDQVNALILPLIFIAVCIILLIIALIYMIIFRNKYHVYEISTNKLYALHPSILNRLKDWNREFPEDMAASILFLYDCRLIDIHKLPSGDIELELIDKTLLKHTLNDNKIDKIDSKTIDFLFNTCEAGSSKVTLDDIKNFAKARSRQFMISYLTWHSELTDKVNQLTQFKVIHKKTRYVFFIISIVIALISIGLGVFFKEWITPLCGVFTGIILAIIANNIRNKLVFKDSNGKIYDVNQIGISFVRYSQLTEDFNKKFIKTIDDCVKLAQDNLSNDAF